MAKYYVKSIYNEKQDGKMCRVKLVESYGKTDFIPWLKAMQGEGYVVKYRAPHNVTLIHEYDSTDVVVLSCKAKIKQSWLTSVYGEDTGFHLIK